MRRGYSQHGFAAEESEWVSRSRGHPAAACWLAATHVRWEGPLADNRRQGVDDPQLLVVQLCGALPGTGLCR